jgi:hypothetical protein
MERTVKPDMTAHRGTVCMELLRAMVRASADAAPGKLLEVSPMLRSSTIRLAVAAFAALAFAAVPSSSQAASGRASS